MTAAESHGVPVQRRLHTPQGGGSGAARPGARRVVRWVALGALAVALIAGTLLALSRARSTPAQATTETATQANVVLAKARTMTFLRGLVVQGNVAAKRFAMVSPRVGGVLDKIFVDEGDSVEAGKTRLFQTDPVKLTKTVEVRRHEVVVAENSLREKQASVQRYQADLDNAIYHRDRRRSLWAKDAAGRGELEDAEADYKRSEALLKYAKALVGLAEAQLNQARSALAIAQKDLDDSLVVAPISGRVAKRLQEPGEMGAAGNPVLRIEDPSLVEVSVYLPARVYGEVAVGKTTMHVTVGGADLGERTISYKSPTIDAQLRTFEARCLVQDPPPAVAPGAMAHVRVILERRKGLGVPRDAIQRRKGQDVLFVASGETTRMVPVKLGLETDGMREVIADELAEGAPVVAVGGYFLDPGARIKTVAEGE